MAIKQDNKFRCWWWFANNQQEELYEVIQAMITDKINETLPQMIEEKMQQFSVDIQTTINGKSSTDIKGIIINELLKDF